VLQSLQNVLTHFKIPELKVFSVYEIRQSMENCLRQIQKKFSQELLIIRSSASDEDQSKLSAAGKYHSELYVDSSNKTALNSAINRVLESYIKSESAIYEHEVIVQRMTQNSIMSGVIFSHEMSSGAPYYVINYDDVTGLTDSVTSGLGEYSNRTLYIHRNGQASLRSERFRKLIAAVRELEDTLKIQHLDIEFAMNDKLEPILFQVRPLTGTPKWDFEKLDSLGSLIASTKSNLENALKSIPGVFGNSNIFGQMPDWNPAEMIGRVPRALAYSLYEELITNGPWLTGRSSMGYHHPPVNKLMFSFAGQPYIDVRLSFNSFLPANLSSTTSNKLINHWLSKLIEAPHYHDKVEFEIVTTCYDFDFDTKAVKLLDGVLDQQELKEFKDKLKDLTFPLLRGEGESSIQKCLDKICQLEAKQNENGFIHSSLNEIIEDCISLGTIPFSMLARHGFIASSIIDSLVRLNIFDNNDISAFHASTETVASKLVVDMDLLNGTEKEREEFFKNYGHLRPGTYDILSPRYSELSMKEFTLPAETIRSAKGQSFILNPRQKEQIDQLLKKEGCADFSADRMIEYLKQAIEGREYGKFIFTRSVSAILESIANWGVKLGVSREILSHLSISEVRHFQKEASSDLQLNLECLKKVANSNQEHWNLCRSIRLPQLLSDCEGIDVVPFQVSQPNFISSKKITGEVIFLDKGFCSDPLVGKVILIENADPGFDWIFSQDILALITKYGGANSHMAIRCNEFGIPAAIGCGEQRFEAIKNAQSISLDCSSRVLTPLFQKHKK
jgi:phosphohistidine swiveling domain-containing protein